MRTKHSVGQIVKCLSFAFLTQSDMHYPISSRGIVLPRGRARLPQYRDVWCVMQCSDEYSCNKQRYTDCDYFIGWAYCTLSITYNASLHRSRCPSSWLEFEGIQNCQDPANGRSAIPELLPSPNRRKLATQPPAGGENSPANSTS